eukprot:TRINITY_DN45782_c0_g1_i1.p1 TRINITY_DN45782_c0_g1~~TRINITY_DN45782_c0_g1_i1.p1  ORF type:complete len:218 (+),score=29.32 TRINITY_DN45782_c0_g1_i1:102-755(+)
MAPILSETGTAARRSGRAASPGLRKGTTEISSRLGGGASVAASTNKSAEIVWVTPWRKPVNTSAEKAGCKSVGGEGVSAKTRGFLSICRRGFALVAKVCCMLFVVVLLVFVAFCVPLLFGYDAGSVAIFLFAVVKAGREGVMRVNGLLRELSVHGLVDLVGAALAQMLVLYHSFRSLSFCVQMGIAALFLLALGSFVRMVFMRGESGETVTKTKKHS